MPMPYNDALILFAMALPGILLLGLFWGVVAWFWRDHDRHPRAG